MSRIRLLVGGALAAAVLTLGGGMAFGTSTASADPGNGNNCVGTAVSVSAHATQELSGMGLGQYLHERGLNPGQDIQAYAARYCGKHA